MDTGEGYMELMESEKARKLINNNPSLETKIFHVGEEVQVKGSRFRVTRITPKKLILRILPKK